ncbi:anthocyanin 5-aromatic acyltransferase-like [Telopea speciosissima]|uniref:anthocyanin 5-aromatic acyltransferase-like n=1 Tax=Telopea speciosissima TaxID=54955 RepID=UPI001CC578B7|nr:anthocyanin 5-aromatic acyltransferase-like [Telopea speciosissima]
MAAFKPVKVLDQCKVAPPPGSVTPTCTTNPLSFLDIFWLALTPVETLYFYEFPNPISHFTESLLPQLKHSLSSTLIHFYPLSGNISWPHEPNQPMICYTEGDSVSFTVAESDADFYHLSSNHPKDAIESRLLVPHLSTSGPILPILAIQVTVFPNTGICIALARNHSSCDGRGFNHFMRTWSSISKLGAPSLLPESLPFLDRTVTEEHDDGMLKMFMDMLDRIMGSESVSGNRILRAMDSELQPNMVRATFELNEANSKRLKEWVFAQYKKDEQTETRRSIPPSRLVAMCAYTWICLLEAEAKTGESNTNNMTLFGINVDCRARLNPPIPETYLGNCVRPCVVIADKTDLMRGGGGEVGVAAQMIGDAVHEMEKGVLKGLPDTVSDYFDLPPGRYLATAGSPQFGYYKTDFGFGRPKKVEMASIDRSGAMFLKESSNEDDGIEFDLVLNRQEMDAFVSLFADGLNALSEYSLCPSTPRSLL